ncbi:thiamine-phosphate pyrophosphorylase [Hathewaya proteolytica DSM 3090]|uniref:Thiamine-phosphate synthase n=1 Tax=Hathewaya proteolytica DSM 3090 TaxID=1121331 RepID=A0A1M6NZ82_9CLOT|nr:thiamine phosphate synthase [Hathewaya proteolytica]SHK00964.1 thiamine-phosphate pyrophosphorylase [Hathewaya proteolytica DSM 3090]
MKCDKENMLLYAVTDRSWLGIETLYSQVEKALKGGVTCVQLREKELDYETFLKEAMEIRELCKKYNVPFIINDNVDIAIKVKADGIHVGQKDMVATKVREMIGENMILGVSSATLEEALEAEKNGADYLGVGAMFTTSTKTDTRQVSLDTIKNICSAVSIPVVAIGGINKTNILQLKGTGVDGVALVSAIFASQHIEEECVELRKLSSEIVK